VRSRVALVLVLAALSFAIGIGVLRFTRSTPRPAMVVAPAIEAPAPDDSIGMRMLELFTGTRITAGNTVSVLLNGNATYSALWADLRSAKRTITLQSYYALPGAVADTLSTILIDRARAGVRVLVLFDAFGSQAMPRAWRDALGRAGVRFVLLRRLSWSTLHNAANRSHVRAIVVDGRIGYTGGFGFADYWLGDGRRRDQWRESNVRVDGPAAPAIQSAFAAAWVEATGELLTGEDFFPRRVVVPGEGGTQAGLFFSAPTVGNTAAERFLSLMIAGARERLYVSSSYFVPNADFRRLLKDAAARGIDVRVLTTSAITDVTTTWLAGRYYYEDLLAAGVRIFEYQPAMMHAKTMVVDGVWTSIGSLNFDNRSLAFNDEASLVVVDTSIGAHMEAVFRDDIGYSREMIRAEFRSRPWWMRAREMAAMLLARVL
jgi:cardiolipin synthase